MHLLEKQLVDASILQLSAYHIYVTQLKALRVAALQLVSAQEIE